jgi:serine/threonine-protein kinase
VWRVPALVIGVIVLMSIIGVGVSLASHHTTVASPPAGDGLVPAGVSSVAAPPEVPSEDNDDSDDLGSPTTEPSQPLDNASAKAALDDELAQDKDTAEQLIDQWVPQLSSKRPGLVVDGVTYGYLQIWQNFEQLRGQYPDALLLWSGNYVSFKSTNFYVTVVREPYSDGQAANQWCDDENIDTDDCYAKLLSHSVGPTGTTVLRS